MSEEILKALMQLFAIIAKQDSEEFEGERLYVENFLKKQVQPKDVDLYLGLFDEKIQEARKKSSRRANRKLTSVTDSVSVLKICMRINKTLDHRQKVISTIQLLEMVSLRKMGKQRMDIILTVADVFNIDLKEFEKLNHLVFPPDESFIEDPDFLIIDDTPSERPNHIRQKGLNGRIVILRNVSSELFIVRYLGTHDLILNGLPFETGSCAVFNPGSSIKTPVGKPIYFSDVYEHFTKGSDKMSISFIADNISYKFDKGNFGIQNLSIHEQQNSLIAIMGASGSGKSTLLNIMAGNYRPHSGSIRINGIDLYENPEELEGVIGLIPQDDLLIENLSVFENLFFNARFCFKDKSKEEITELVNETLRSLDLYQIRDLAVGNSLNKLISGGQRKRLNIALELIREPSILFVDEPTSGLSSLDSENVMDLLRRLSLTGKLIFVVIHQPSSDIYKIFDRVLLLDEGGYLIQYGNPIDIISYFKEKDGQASYEQTQCPNCGNINAEQIFNIVSSEIVDEYGNYTHTRKKSPKDWHQFYLESKEDYDLHESTDTPPKNLSIPSLFNQVIIYFKRDFKSKISNKAYLLIAFLEAPILAFILTYIIRYIPSGNVYTFRLNENLPQYIFMSIIVAMFMGLTISAEEIFRDRKILKREAFLNLSKTAYLIAKMSILLVISAIQSLLFVAIGNSVFGIEGMWISYWFTFFSVAFFSNLLGLIISSSFDEVVTIYIIIPLLIIPQMVLGGAMFSFDKMNNSIVRIDKVPVIAEMMVAKWSYEALMVNQFVNNRFEKHFYDLERAESHADFHQVYYIPELNKYLKKVELLLSKDRSTPEFSNAYELIMNEYKKQIKAYPELKIDGFSDIKIEDFNNDNINEYKEFLEKLKKIYNKEFFLAHNKISLKLDYYMRNYKDKYYALRNRYQNEAVSDIVTQFYEKNKILNSNNHLIQHVDAIYNYPVVDSYFDFRSHLFAPKKHIFGKFYETFYFNMSIIWIMNLIMFFVLRFNLLRKLIQFKIK